MNYAIIEDGVCVNIIVADEDVAAELNAIPLPDGYGIGDYYISEEWLKSEYPEPEPIEPTQNEKREHAYMTLIEKDDGTPLLLWSDKELTVDQANDLWIKYSAEGDIDMTGVLQVLIHEAKQYIRELYPDKEEIYE